MSIFESLNAVDITDQLKEKNKLSYLPWSSAWAIVKSRFPDSTYRIIKTDTGCIYHTDMRTCWVEVEVTIEGETQSETLAVMNHRNQPIPYEEVTSVDANKSIKRALTKCLALFGLGLSLWNGEELSDAAKQIRRDKLTREAEEEKERIAELAAANQKIAELAQAKIAEGADRDAIYAIIMKYTGGKKNPNSIQNIEDSESCYLDIEKNIIADPKP